VRLMLVDACRNELVSGSRGLDVDNLPRPTKGTAVLFSCKSGEKAFESDKLGKGHGIFFYHVIAGLKGEARNLRGEITWTRLADYVTEKVADETPVLVGGGAKQTPHEIKNLEGRSPVLVGARGDEAELQRLLNADLDYEVNRRVADKEAANRFRKAADKGDADAMSNLGSMYENGQGVRKDRTEALKWYRKAAGLGHEDAKKAVQRLESGE